MRKLKMGLLRFFLIIPILALLPSALSAQSICSKVKIEIAQELTFERQAFEATMTISNAITDTDLENVNVELIFKNKDGNPVVATTDTNGVQYSIGAKLT